MTEQLTCNEPFLGLSRAHFRRTARRLLAILSPKKRRERMQWLTRECIAFLRSIGLAEGDTVLDFGCGPGNFSIPAALLVGDNGLVLSAEQRVRVLRKLVLRAAGQGLRNIRTTSHLEDFVPLAKDRPCKLVLAHDVLHFMDATARKRLYNTFHSMLKPDGVLSVYPAHIKGDDPSRHFRDMTADDVEREIEGTGFWLCERKETDLWHDCECVRAIVMIFRQGNEEAKGHEEAFLAYGK